MGRQAKTAIAVIVFIGMGILYHCYQKDRSTEDEYIPPSRWKTQLS